MAVIQEISARIGRVTGAGIASQYSRDIIRSPSFTASSRCLLVANVFNLGADIGAMGAAAKFFLPGSRVGLHSCVSAECLCFCRSLFRTRATFRI